MDILPENVAFLLERRLKPRLKFAEVRTFREYLSTREIWSLWIR